MLLSNEVAGKEGEAETESPNTEWIDPMEKVNQINSSEALKAAELLVNYMKNDGYFDPNAICSILKVGETIRRKHILGLKQSRLDFYFS